MTDDKRFGAHGADDDAVRDDAGEDPVGGRHGLGAAPDGSAAQPEGPAGAGIGDDPVASELGAIFAAALADEPPSRVTEESVLRAVRGEKRSARVGFGSWLVSGRAPAKWAGGLVAVAALVAAAIVVAPTTGSSPDRASTAASGLYGSAASGSSEAAQERMAAADSAAGAAVAEAAPSPGVSEMSGSSESSQSAPEAYTAMSDGAGSDTGDAAGDQARSSEATGPTSSVGDAAAQSSPAAACALPELAPQEWSAAVATLPSDVAATRLPGAGCQAGALRGNGIEVARGAGLPATYLWLVVSQGPIGRDGAASDSIVVSASRGGLTATVIANQSGSPWLDDAALQRLVDAVADAAG